MSIIVTVSGGKASAWCAYYALSTYPKEDVILYFNDTKWEHPDLYRFLDDLSSYLNHPIIIDADGRSPEQLFHDNHALANNRMPFCSRILKAERLQRFYKNGDTLIFGIGNDEKHRANRIIGAYQKVAAKTNRFPIIEFPLITNDITKGELDNFLISINISQPLLYTLGFAHNNCSGGCVRAGKKHWKLLYEMLPEVYLDRERVENDLRADTKKDIHFFKDETLTHFRERIDNKEIVTIPEDENAPVECIGICEFEN